MTLTETTLPPPKVRSPQSGPRRSVKHSTLHHYLKLAHQGFGSKKVGVHTHRLYRSLHSHNPKGVHDFHNLQWDPSIYRGRTFRDFREKNLPPFSTTLNADKYCGYRYPPKAEGTSLKWKKSSQVPKIGGIVRPTTGEIMDDEVAGRKRKEQDSRCDWDAFIVEQVVIPEYKEEGSQPDEETPYVDPRKCLTVASGLTRSVQANIPYIGEVEKLDPIEPVITTVGSKIVEQSLFESMEEYELESIFIKIREFINLRLERQMRIARLIENEKTKAEQRNSEKLLTQRQMRFEEEAEWNIGATLFASQLNKRILDETFESLLKQNYMQVLGKGLSETIEPWFNRKVVGSFAIPRKIVTDIIENAQLQIETDFALAIADNYIAPPNSDSEVEGEVEEGIGEFVYRTGE